MYRKDRRIMGLLYVFDVDGIKPGSHVILVWIDHHSDRQIFDYNTQVNHVIIMDKYDWFAVPILWLPCLNHTFSDRAVDTQKKWALRRQRQGQSGYHYQHL